MNTPNPFDDILQKLELIDEKLLGLEERISNLKDIPEPVKFLTVPETAEFLSISKSRVYQLIHDRQLPTIKKFGKCYFQKSELISYLREGRRKTQQEIYQEAANY